MRHNYCACTPWQHFHQLKPFLAVHRLNPELYLSHTDLETISHTQVTEINNFIKDNRLTSTIHAPTEHMEPGSSIPEVRQFTKNSLYQTIKLAKTLQAKVLVVHTGFDPLSDDGDQLRWLEQSTQFWQELLPQLSGTTITIALENLLEKTPTPLRTLIERIKNHRIRHCFDIGHFKIASSVSLESWFSELGMYCVECHLHDNNGSSDQHLQVGDSTTDFKRLKELLLRHAPSAYLTFEAHNQEDQERSYHYFKNI